MRVHALVEDAPTGLRAVEDGATVVQLRLKDAPTARVVEIGRRLVGAGATFVVNDDVDAALELGADGVHLGRGDAGAELALERGLHLGLSAASVEEAVQAAARGAAYIGAGPIWTTPSKADADPPIGLSGLADIARAVEVPVVAIGGVDATNAADCIRAGAAGVAVIRAVQDLRAVRTVVDEALAAR